MRAGPWLLLALLLGVTGCAPATGGDEDRPLAGAGMERTLGTPGAHEHGVARMNVAVEDEHLVLELFVPGHSVYGFEGAPRNEAQRAARAEGSRLLRERAGELVHFSAQAECTVADARLTDETTHHAHDADDAHGHDHGAAPGHSHDHGDSRDQGHTHGHTHDHGDSTGHDHDHEGAIPRCSSRR